MPKTCLQTVEIKILDSPFPIYSLEFCPIAPEGVLAMKEDDGSTIMWFKDKTMKWTPALTVLTWPRRPLEHDAVLSQGKGEYYEFKSGAIFAKKNGIPYYWSKPTESSVVVGSVLNVHVCNDTDGEYFLDGQKCVCPTCYTCNNRVEDDGPFCSDVCQAKGLTYFRD